MGRAKFDHGRDHRIARRPLRHLGFVTLILTLLSLPTVGTVLAVPATAAPKPKPPAVTASVTPTSVVAGSSGNSLSFQFNTSKKGKGVVAVAIPSGWSTSVRQCRGRGLRDNGGGYL